MTFPLAASNSQGDPTETLLNKIMHFWNAGMCWLEDCSLHSFHLACHLWKYFLSMFTVLNDVVRSACLVCSFLLSTNLQSMGGLLRSICRNGMSKPPLLFCFFSGCRQRHFTVSVHISVDGVGTIPESFTVCELSRTHTHSTFFNVSDS